jgi:acetyl-CoA carboxylase biotin carboxyl carrier protein
MEIKEIQELVKMFDKSNLGEISIERPEFKITLKTKLKEVVSMVTAPVNYAPAPTAAPSANTEAPAPAAAPAEPVATGTTFKSPMIGTFYRSAGPDKPVFVKPGDVVKKGQILCIIEAMKLFNEIECEMDGTITKVLIDDASPVEYDQPLFLIS